MHEKTLLDDLMRRIGEVARENGASRIARVRVRVGELSHLTPGHFREHFRDASRGTVAEGAEVEVETLVGTTHPNARDVILDSVDLGS